MLAGTVTVYIKGLIVMDDVVVYIWITLMNAVNVTVHMEGSGVSAVPGTKAVSRGCLVA